MIDTPKIGRNITRLLGGLVIVFLIAPLLVIIPLSFNGSGFLSYPLQGFSLQWYEKVFTGERWLLALRNSVIVGLATVAIATPLGTLAALGLSSANFRGKAVLIAALISPMIVPTIITGVGIFIVFSKIGLVSTLTGLILAHVVLAVPFVLITVNASLAQMDKVLLRASASLGASPLLTFRTVTLPLILPGVASGAIFAFATSFDEIIVAIFLTGSQTRTLPRELLSGTRENLDPTVMAVATLLIIFSTVLLLLFLWLQTRNKKNVIKT